ncbi:MAG TPA: protein TolQ [Methylophaga sp.]|jgi:biopolymer transport protein TolQ|uniref:protein TolQ n=1 Tax=unclassified Methylophaga TaxID=2629249 RepID=UPI000C8C16A3|nr:MULTISPECIES: protein TolQ [unclassified Methylophaga]MAP25857.1 protein TolQ [Methylophaga sp.]HAD32462.1 protein TolQ [Methylophaga sp.]HCO00237.1 protein TolQ [Methylophaga sp.]|tara:strand:+ start:1988 stop:2689 length:702 start_codon:yes stop_codon:yes gene_type:complete
MESSMHEMTMWGLVSEASLLVKIVMIILVLASMVSWYLIIWRSRVLGRLEKQNRQFQLRFRQTADLTKLDSTANNQTVYQALPAIYQAGLLEYEKYRQLDALPQDEIVENVERAMLVNIGEQEVELEKGLSYLATIGSVSPYIGLFGTVWGIMNSFIGLSQVEQATLNTVAPGIAEALIATAIGLFAAIPAVVAYNQLSKRAGSLSTRYYHFGNEFITRLQRVLHRTPLAKVA